MLADSFVERNSVILKNINDNAQTEPNVWYSGTGYGFYSIPYSDYLILGHYYYLRSTYKFTTTNQSPTWCTMYFQGGGGSGGPSVSSPIAGTEYTLSGIRQPVITNTSAPISSGTMYNGDSNKINGVTSYVKNVMVYDVTNLYYLLKANNVVTTTDALKTWCDTNLAFTARRVPYNITGLVTSAINNVAINKGAVIANEFVEADGMQYYSATSGLRNNTYFDVGSGLGIYNNFGNGTVTHTRVSAEDQNSPFYPEHKSILKIITDGSASPDAGGFIAQHIAAANKIFVEKFVAKVPVGYNITSAYNPQGTGSSVTYLTPRAGTGNWEEYCILYKCGSSGSFSSGGHVRLAGNNTGKNLCKYALVDNFWNQSNYASRTSSYIKNNIYHVDSLVSTNTDTSFSITTKNYIVLPANTKVYISFDVRTNMLPSLGIHSSGNTTGLINSSGTRFNIPSQINLNTDEQWHRISFNVTTGADTQYKVNIGADSPNIYGTGAYIEVKNIMVSTSSDTTFANYDKNDCVVWYLAYANNCEITSNEALKNFSVLNNKLSIKGGTLSTDKLDETNLLPNGDGSDTSAAMLSSGWTYDTTDVAGNAKASIVQPVGVGKGYYGLNLPIDPNSRYKISYWVKCKADMSSFLTAIIYKRANGGEFNHTNTVWVPGTKTTLSAQLSSGDTSMAVASAANWTARSYSRVGFRSGSTWSCPTYNDKGTSNMPSGSTGMIANVSGNTVNFNTAYTGSTMPAGTVVVESYDGGTWPYPIGKGNLPTDNTWKYVEGYFGANNTVWEGSSSSGWTAIPQEARYIDIRLNLYNNNGSVPIKYADIRVEAIGTHDGHRRENKIQIKKED